MAANESRTIGGERVSPELIEGLLSVFERDWDPGEVSVAQTDYGKAIIALQALDIPSQEIEALERRAEHEHKPLPFFLRQVLQNELAG